LSLLPRFLGALLCLLGPPRLLAPLRFFGLPDLRGALFCRRGPPRLLGAPLCFFGLPRLLGALLRFFGLPRLLGALLRFFGLPRFLGALLCFFGLPRFLGALLCFFGLPRLLGAPRRFFGLPRLLVVGSAAVCAFRFRPPGTGSKRAGWRRSGAIFAFFGAVCFEPDASRARLRFKAVMRSVTPHSRQRQM
jgi:hypothetical protein